MKLSETIKELQKLEAMGMGDYPVCVYEGGEVCEFFEIYPDGMHSKTTRVHYHNQNKYNTRKPNSYEFHEVKGKFISIE